MLAALLVHRLEPVGFTSAGAGVKDLLTNEEWTISMIVEAWVVMPAAVELCEWACMVLSEIAWLLYDCILSVTPTLLRKK